MVEREEGGVESAFAKLQEEVNGFLDNPSAGSAVNFINCATELKNEDAIKLSDNDNSLVVRVFWAVNYVLFDKDVSAAQEVFLSKSCGEPSDDEVLIWFFLLVRCRVLVDATYEAFSTVRKRQLSILGKAAKEMVRLKWRYEGPDEQLLNYIFQLRQGIKSKELTRESVALSLYLNKTDLVAVEVNEHAWLKHEFNRLLPLASFLFENNLSESPDVIFYHNMHLEILHNSSQLAQQIKEETVAVVGNSPCELGSGKGKVIDSYSLVVRFNYFSVREHYSSDYGRRFDVHVRGAGDTEELADRSSDARFVVLNQYNFLYHFRRWEHLKALYEKGVRLCCLPSGHHFPLQKELKAEPSLGLSFLKFVKDVTNHVERSQCFGFSLSDQLSGKAHYFDHRQPAYTHNWIKEKQIFEGWVDNNDRFEKSGYLGKAFVRLKETFFPDKADTTPRFNAP